MEIKGEVLFCLAALAIVIIVGSVNSAYRIGAVATCESSGGAYLKEVKTCVNLTAAGFCAMDKKQTMFKQVPGMNLNFSWTP